MSEYQGINTVEDAIEIIQNGGDEMEVAVDLLETTYREAMGEVDDEEADVEEMKACPKCGKKKCKCGMM